MIKEQNHEFVIFLEKHSYIVRSGNGKTPEIQRKVVFMEEMSKEEMQRFLIKEAQRGSTEMEAYRNLMEILGIEFPKDKSKDT